MFQPQVSRLLSAAFAHICGMRKALLFLFLPAVCADILAQYQYAVWSVNGPTPLNDSFLKWESDVVFDERISVRPVEWSTSGLYHVNWWISDGGGIGYRHVTQALAEIRQAYQGWIYVVKLRIKFAKLVRSIWDQSVRDEY